jgi:hypothetical protein
MVTRNQGQSVIEDSNNRRRKEGVGNMINVKMIDSELETGFIEIKIGNYGVPGVEILLPRLLK